MCSCYFHFKNLLPGLVIGIFFNVIGNLFFHGVKKEVSLPVDLQIKEDRVIIKSSFEIRLSDYQIKRPSLLAIRINDVITIEFYLVGRL